MKRREGAGGTDFKRRQEKGRERAGQSGWTLQDRPTAFPGKAAVGRGNWLTGNCRRNTTTTTTHNRALQPSHVLVCIVYDVCCRGEIHYYILPLL
jgi:hypothetical protein